MRPVRCKETGKNAAEGVMSMKWIRWFTNLRVTAIALLVAGLSYILSYGGMIEVFEHIADSLHALEEYEVDEIVVGVVILIVGVLVDSFRISRRKQEAMRQERMRIFQATMATVHDLVNNALNNLQLLRMEAEEINALRPESLELFDAVVHSTAKQLTLLGSVEEIVLYRRAGGLEAISYANREPSQN
jgi:hypothetical protein